MQALPTHLSFNFLVTPLLPSLSSPSPSRQINPLSRKLQRTSLCAVHWCSSGDPYSLVQMFVCDQPLCPAQVKFTSAVKLSEGGGPGGGLDNGRDEEENFFKRLGKWRTCRRHPSKLHHTEEKDG